MPMQMPIAYLLLGSLLIFSTLAMGNRTINTTTYRLSTVHKDRRGINRFMVDCINHSNISQRLTLRVLPGSDVRTGPGTAYVTHPVSGSKTFTVDANSTFGSSVTIVCDSNKDCLINTFGVTSGERSLTTNVARVDMSSKINFGFEIDEDRGAIGCSLYGYAFGAGGTYNYLISPSRLEVNGGRPF